MIGRLSELPARFDPRARLRWRRDLSKRGPNQEGPYANLESSFCDYPRTAVGNNRESRDANSECDALDRLKDGAPPRFDERFRHGAVFSRAP
jgi:hypothetical protein